MNTNILKNLPEQQVAQLAQLVQRIIQVIHPAQIICYGYRISSMDAWSCFLDGDMHKKDILPTYDLLIIINDEEKRAHYEVIEIAEKQAITLDCGTTIIVQQLNAANNALQSGCRFTSNVYHKGKLLYNGIGLALPPGELDIALLKDRTEENWHRYFSMSRRFLKTANYCFENGWNEQTVFDLHQSLEHACLAILRAYTGYRPTTHNLSRLLNLTCNFSQELMAVFPRQTKEEAALFNTLNRAYSEARYNERYTVSNEVTKIILERITILLDLIEKLYERKCLRLEAAQPISFPVNVNSQ